MASMGVEVKRAWLSPKIVGTSPTARWGHTACFFQNHLYVFGGCCGGLHFSDVLALNLDSMSWTTLLTSGSAPGLRDSHTATLWGSKVIMFGGTNGSRKGNDLHILDLISKEWIQPACHGVPPLARESHTANLVGGERLVVFGGSGEGNQNYLNDLHILDLKTMTWTSLTVEGDVPPPRDSHVSVAIGSKLYIYGGDCGDRYLGDVDVFDVDLMTWSRLEVCGPLPGRRAGHAAVAIGNNVYVIGGVGNKKYYNDTWVLNTATSTWSLLENCSQMPQGRFSHTAVFTDSDILVYGGCGEDERPLGELLILQMGADHVNGQHFNSLSTFEGYWKQEKIRGLNGRENGLKTMLLGSCIDAPEMEGIQLDASRLKKRRAVNLNSWEKESEPEEHSLTLSQNSSPSQSDQEQTTAQNPTVSKRLRCQSLTPLNKTLSHPQPDESISLQNLPDVYFRREQRPNHNHASPIPSIRGDPQISPASGRSMNQCSTRNLIGAEVQGKVDGAFDSGFLVTATVNGRVFRGVLFTPGPEVVQRGSNLDQSPITQIPVALPCMSNRVLTQAQSPIFQPSRCRGFGTPRRISNEKADQPSPIFRSISSKDREMRERNDLQGVVLTLGGPGSGLR